MNTAVINIKTQPEIKKKAQVIAAELGFSLSSLINAYLKQLVKTKSISFSVLKEEPTDYLLKSLKQSKKDIKNGRVVSFNNGDDAISYLDKLIEHDRNPSKN
jgi:addiction module RelB/DinJ family antitoxin